MAEALDGGHVVGDEDERLAGVALLAEDVHALLGEGRVADGEHLVDEHDVGVGLDHDREGEADHHARGVVLELEVDEVRELGELEHGVQPGAAPRGAPRPIITPLSATFSRAVSSGLKPTPSSMNGASRPAMRIRPGVGAVDARRGSSAACSCPSRCARRSRRTRPGAHRRRSPRNARNSRYSPLANGCAHALLERVDLVVGDPERLLDVAHLDQHRAELALAAEHLGRGSRVVDGDRVGHGREGKARGRRPGRAP